MERKSIMWKYIAEEKQILGSLLNSRDVKEAVDRLPPVKTLYFVAHGSSYNAACAVSDFLSRHMHVRTYVYTPANFLYNCSTIEYEDRGSTLIAAISQTGSSRGVLEGVKKAKALGFLVLGLTSVSQSPLNQLSDYRIPIRCGEEESNAKTKGYSSTLLLLLMLGMEYGLEYGRIDYVQYNHIYNELAECIDGLDQVMEKTVQWCERTQFGKDIKDIYVLGYGMNYGTAMEGQLKLMETMCMPAMFNDIEEFSHGMHRSIDNNSNILLINTDHHYNILMVKTFYYLLKKTEHTTMINANGTNIDNEMVMNQKWYPITQSILGITTAIQVLSVYIPELNGRDPNTYANDDYTQYALTRI